MTDHPIEQLHARQPHWSRTKVAEVFLGELGRQAGFCGPDAAAGHVEQEFGVKFDEDGELTLTDKKAEEVWKTVLADQ